jgi:hypothetical protein
MEVTERMDHVRRRGGRHPADHLFGHRGDDLDALVSFGCLPAAPEEEMVMGSHQ